MAKAKKTAAKKAPAKKAPAKKVAAKKAATRRKPVTAATAAKAMKLEREQLQGELESDGRYLAKKADRVLDKILDQVLDEDAELPDTSLIVKALDMAAKRGGALTIKTENKTENTGQNVVFMPATMTPEKWAKHAARQLKQDDK